MNNLPRVDFLHSGLVITGFTLKFGGANRMVICPDIVPNIYQNLYEYCFISFFF